MSAVTVSSPVKNGALQISRQASQTEASKGEKPKAPKRRRSGEADFPAEFDEVRGYEIREKLRPKKNAKKERPAKANKAKKKAKKRPEKERLPKRPAHIKEQKPACLNPVADYLPIEKVENGIIYTKDHRFVKVVEVVPINFMLRSAREQRNIIYSFRFVPKNLVLSTCKSRF